MFMVSQPSACTVECAQNYGQSSGALKKGWELKSVQCIVFCKCFVSLFLMFKVYIKPYVELPVRL